MTSRAKADQADPARHNRVLALGLGFLALALYLAITWRWTQGF